MIGRLAALLGLLSFAGAWLVGVWCRHSPRSRIENAFLALLFGVVAGALTAVALQRIVLARLADELPQLAARRKEEGDKR